MVMGRDRTRNQIAEIFPDAAALAIMMMILCMGARILFFSCLLLLLAVEKQLWRSG